MADYVDLLTTDSVRAARAANASFFWDDERTLRDTARLGDPERAFIAARDSFYLASVSENGWPYIQHRGGPRGFLKVLDERRLGFADYRGNRQYISLGNIAADDRVSVFLMDYPNRRRLKLLAHMQMHDLGAEPELAARLAMPDYRAKTERGFVLTLEAFDWNCPQHIAPRFTEDELQPLLDPVRLRLAALEQENAALRQALADAQIGGSIA